MYCDSVSKRVPSRSKRAARRVGVCLVVMIIMNECTCGFAQPDKGEGKGYACGDNQYCWDACGGKDDGVFEHGVVHDEVIVDIIGVIAADESFIL